MTQSQLHPNRRRFLTAVGAAAGSAVLGGTATKAISATPSPPHIVIFLIDDLGYADCGFTGGEIKTPHIDRLAAAGARLDQFYVQPLCTPTRAALLTGRYPMRHGLQVGVCRPWARYGLPLEERTLAQALKQAGYKTAICGKWHLGHFQRDYLPTHRGFDHQYGHYNGALDYFTHLRDGGLDWHRNDKACYDEGYTTHLIARESVRLIREHDAAKPLFLYVPFNAVHSPLQVPEEYEKPYASLPPQRRTYAGMLAAVDEAIGQIADALTEKGMLQNTFILFASDNGGPAPGRVTSNGSFRAGKGTLYEGGVRVCAFATWPGRIQPGSVVKAPLHIADMYPTLLTMAGVSLDQPLPLDGRNALGALTRGEPSPHDAILLNTTPLSGAIRMGDWKLVVNGQLRDDGSELRGESDGGAPKSKKAKAGKKDAAAAGGPVIELFNLADDPSEKENLAERHRDKVRELRLRYEEFARQAVPPKNAPPAPDYTVPKVWGEA
ncbi:MAG: arylsulfatase [Candidatus Sumerlaeia bacterium]|nr:arylsulfatase [Candidatus Sumerlaeia bacterium]